MHNPLNDIILDDANKPSKPVLVLTDAPRQGGKSVIINPFDAWVIDRVLHDRLPPLNGEATNVSPKFQPLVEHLGFISAVDRRAALLGYLAHFGHEGQEDIIRAIADADASGPAPTIEGRRRTAHLGDLTECNETSRFIWPGWLVRGHLNLLSSDPKVGKTYLTLWLAYLIYHHLKWPDGQPPTFPGGTKTIWICADRNQDEVRDYADAFGLPREAVLLNSYEDDAYGGCDLDDQKNIDRLRERVDAEKPALVVIDTVWRGTGRKLCKEGDVNLLMNPLIEMAQESNTTILGLMHLSKDGDTLGRRLEGAARGILKLHKPDDSQKDRRKLLVKGNFKESDPLGVTFRDGGCDFDSSPPEERVKNQGGRPPAARAKAEKFIREALTLDNGQIGNDLRKRFEKDHGGCIKTFWDAVKGMEENGDLLREGGKGTGKQTVLHLYPEETSEP